MYAVDNLAAQRAEWSLIAYVELSLRRHAANWRRKLYRRTGFELMLINAPVGGEPGEGAEYGELLSGASGAEEDYLLGAPVEELLTDQAVYQAYIRLPEQQRQVIKHLILDGTGMKQQALARRLNVTQQAVCKSKQQALRRLRESIVRAGA